MSSQKEYLELQLKRIEAEMTNLAKKSERLRYRYSQLDQQRQALREDLKSLGSVTKPRSELKLVQTRQAQIKKLDLSGK